jgi:hypothetical protein
MFTQQKFYDLNAQTEARRRLFMENVKKNIERSANYPTVVEPNKQIFKNPQMGSPAFAMSIKQRQQAINYEVREFPQSQNM